MHLGEISPRRLLWACLLAAACNLSVAGGRASAATYHVDSEDGSDQASGLSPEQAWRTLSHVNTIRLKPGDSVLFKRGRAWTGQLEITSSGRAGASIMFAAYGVGARPVFERGAHGIVSQDQSHIEIRDLHIRSTGLSGAWVKGGNGWHFTNMLIERTGNRKDVGGIAWWHGKDLTISGSVLKNITGDGIWAWAVDGLRLLNNYIGVVQGPASDNAHIQHARNFEIRGNVFSMEGPTNSGKGNMLLGNSDGGVIANNNFIAGNFGIGIDTSNTVVEFNHFLNHNSATWSAALNMAAGRSRNLMIRNNKFDGSRVGLSLFELKGQWADAPVVRANMIVANNVFDVRQNALTVAGPVQYSGGFIDNTIVGSPASDWNRRSGKISEGGWKEYGTRFVKTPPPWTGGAPCTLVKDLDRRNDIGSAGPALPTRSGDTYSATVSCTKM
jgi:polysaccharidase protein